VRLVPRSLVVVAAGLSLLLGACGPGTGTASEAAVVDGRSISRDQVDQPVRDALNRSGAIEGLDADQRAEIVEPLQRQVLSLLIQASVIEDIADERGIEVDQSRIDERLEADAEGAGGEDELADALAQQQLSVGLYRDVLLPTQQRIEALREQLTGDIEPSEAREARHILVESDEEAQGILRELADGGDFAALAEEHSIDPGSGQRGGDLGPAPRGAYVGPFDEAVWNAEIGDIVGPVETQFGFHVIQVTDEVTVSSEDMSPQERDQQASQLLNQLLEERFAAAVVEVSDRFGAWNAQTGEVERGAEVGADE
jgi:peptidyl-prolyl cis-trans isomerase C